MLLVLNSVHSVAKPAYKLTVSATLACPPLHNVIYADKDCSNPQGFVFDSDNNPYFSEMTEYFKIKQRVKHGIVDLNSLLLTGIVKPQ